MSTIHFELYLDDSRQYRWRLWSANARIIANSGEGYHNKADCLAAIDLVKGTSASTPIRDTTTGLSAAQTLLGRGAPSFGAGGATLLTGFGIADGLSQLQGLARKR